MGFYLNKMKLLYIIIFVTTVQLCSSSPLKTAEEHQLNDETGVEISIQKDDIERSRDIMVNLNELWEKWVPSWWQSIPSDKKNKDIGSKIDMMEEANLNMEDDHFSNKERPSGWYIFPTDF